jgi:GNAT superfamily N-acetyltransferase
MVLATVHRDVLESLEPDIVIDTDRGQWASGRWLRRPEVVVEVRPCDNALWGVFAPHHYLAESINRSAHCYMALWGEHLVGFVAAIAYPSGTLKSAYREHRLVVLPDFQGLGIGPRLSEAVAQHYVDHGKRYFSKTSHPRIGEYRDGSARWRATSKNHRVRRDGIGRAARWDMNPYRWTYSHEFVGGGDR